MSQSKKAREKDKNLLDTVSPFIIPMFIKTNFNFESTPKRNLSLVGRLIFYYNLFKPEQIQHMGVRAGCSTLTSTSGGIVDLPMSYSYSVSGNTEIVADSYNKFMSCSGGSTVNECGLYLPADCSGTTTATSFLTSLPNSSPFLFVGSSSPWQITISTSNAMTEPYQYCYFCKFSNGASSTSSIQTFANQRVFVYDTSGAALKNYCSNDAQTRTAIYSSSTLTHTFATKTEYLHTDKRSDTYCNDNTNVCSLLSSDCSSIWSNSDIQLDSSQNLIGIGNPAGNTYSHTVCVKCLDSGGTKAVSQQTWTLNLVLNQCSGAFLGAVAGSQTAVTKNYHSTETAEPITISSSFTDWETYFQKQSGYTCSITSCSLLNNDCSTSLSGSQITMASGYPWSISMDLTPTTSYQHTVCVKCTLTSSDTVEVKDWVITKNAQTSCSALTAPTLSHTSQLRYVTGSASAAVTASATFTNWEAFFDNTDSNCFFTSCVLRDQNDCSGSTLSHSDKISMGTVSPWAVSASQTVEAGYSITVCVRCTNSGVTVDYNQWVITQTAKCSLTSNSATDVKLLYSSTSSTQTITPSSGFTTWDAFFSNTDATNCPITSCAISTSGNCGAGDFTGSTDLALSSSNPWGLTGSLTNSKGYFYTVCIQCSNADAQAQADAWTISLCSTQTIQLAKTGDKVVSSTSLNSGTGKLQKVLLANYQGKFQSTISGCAISTYALMTVKTDGSYTAYTGTDVYLDSSSNLVIKTSSVLSKILYIEASNPTFNSYSYLPVYITVSNYAPFFVNGPPSGATILYDYENPSETSSYTYNLPEFSDNEDSNVTIQVDGLQSFMTYDEVAKVIKFEVDPDLVGNYEISLVLTDSGGMTASADISFEINTINQVVEEEKKQTVIPTDVKQTKEADKTPNKDKNNELNPQFKFEVEQEVKEICKASVYQMTALGDLIILFSTPMRTQFINITQINSTVIDMYIVPAEERETNEGFRWESVNFTWKITEFGKFDEDSSQLVIKLTFDEPIQISPLVTQDMLMIYFNDTSFFISETLKKPLDDEYRELHTKVKKQMDQSPATESFQATSEQGSTAVKGMMIFSFILNLVLSGAMDYMVAWINSLQLIIHLPMLMTLIPANVASFFALILPVVQFDLIPPQYSYELFLSFDEEPDEQFQEAFETTVFDQMKDLGYESHNSLQLLGSLFIFALLYYVRVIIVFPVVFIYSKLFKKGQDYLKSLRYQLFFSEFIVINIEAFLELLVAGYINYIFPLSTTDGEIVAQYVSYYAFFVCIIVMPSISVWVLIQDMQTINSHEFRRNWEGFYDGIQTKNKWQVFYYFGFQLRRFVFLMICFILAELPGIQLVCLNLLNLMNILHVGYFTPFKTRFRNRLEIFNEVAVIVSSFYMMCFTDLVQTLEAQNVMGWSMIATIVCNCLVNIVLICGAGARGIYLIFLRYYRRIKHKLNGSPQRQKSYILRTPQMAYNAKMELQKLLAGRQGILDKLDSLERRKSEREKNNKILIEDQQANKELQLEEEQKKNMATKEVQSHRISNQFITFGDVDLQSRRQAEKNIFHPQQVVKKPPVMLLDNNEIVDRIDILLELNHRAQMEQLSNSEVMNIDFYGNLQAPNVIQQQRRPHAESGDSFQLVSMNDIDRPDPQDSINFVEHKPRISPTDKYLKRFYRKQNKIL